MHKSDTASPAGVSVEMAWSPESSPGVTSSAVYLIMTNGLDHPMAIVSAQSPDFAMAHIHRTSIVDGLASMEPVDHLVIPAGGQAAFSPMGLHIMLMGATEHHHAGEAIPVSLIFEDETRCDFVAEVTRPGEAPRTGQGKMPGMPDS